MRKSFWIYSDIVLIPSQLVNSHPGPAEPLIWTGTEQRHNLVPEGTLAIVGDALHYRNKAASQDQYATTAWIYNTCA